MNIYKKALIRALHTFWEALAATIPAGVIITADMIKTADWKNLLLTVAGWIVTALLAAALSFIKSMAVGMPETTPPDVDYTWEQYQADKGRITFMANEDGEENVN